ncbi:NACHT, LRR and PYD domains-containing protein 13-like [Hydractinia symbiolongicarpus]|uniref:NACHT, LRR and PYD domains-containing protein 13-like n=1 Tax=Hydractinia symbiolongicarpus TaxID=13093 RepID=UPI002551AD16|nr:NACHT, LRR and PYD domains-containing protein 13-like [Hydractinia symbiolongicarpus]
MEACFKLLKYNISWRTIQHQLNRLQRDDIIQNIIEKTNITETLNNSLKNHRQFYIDTLSEQQVALPVMSKYGMMHEPMKREDAYVDLAIMQSYIIDEKWRHVNREYHLYDINALRKQNKLYEIEDIVKFSDHFVTLSGIAGSGKSTLFENMILKWANNVLWNGENDMPNVKLLLPIKCSVLNNMAIQGKTWEVVLKELFPILFDCTTIEDLMSIRKHILILIDGVDELQTINESKANVKSSKDDFIHSLISPVGNVLSGKRVVLLGRPGACHQYQTKIGKHCQVKTLEVCGFTADNIKIYVEKAFENEYTQAKETVLLKITESETLKAMATVPIYLWAICGLYQDDLSIEAPKTTTELLLYVCLLYLRNHSKIEGCANDDISLQELCSSGKVIRYITEIAELSYHTLRKQQVFFEGCGDTNKLEELEKTGLIVKSRDGGFGYVYQFRHLVLQELLCALYMFFNVGAERLLENTALKCCLPIVAGLEGIYVSLDGKRNILKTFLRNLDSVGIDRVVHFMGNLEECFIKSHEKCKTFDIHTLCRDITEYFICFYESQNTFSFPMIEFFTGKHFRISFSGMSDHEVRYVYHFLDCLLDCASVVIDDFYFDASNPFHLKPTIIKCLKYCNRVKVTSSKKDFIWVEFATMLFNLLKSSPLQLQLLSLSELDTSNINMEVIAACLPYLHKVKFRKMKFMETTIRLIGQSLEHHVTVLSSCKLTQISFNDCDFSSDSLTQLSLCMKHVQTLEIRNSKLEKENIETMSNQIEELASIHQLQLSSLILYACGLTSQLFKCLLKSLKHLKVVSLHGNDFDDETLALLDEELSSWCVSCEKNDKEKFDYVVMLDKIHLGKNSFTLDKFEELKRKYSYLADIYSHAP